MASLDEQGRYTRQCGTSAYSTQMASSESNSPQRGGEEPTDSQASTLELFFDLVFVFGFIQVTRFLSNSLTWPGMVRGAALLAALWWAWAAYSWLTDAIPAHEVLSERLVVLSAVTAMFVASIAVPGAFGDDAVLFGVAYFVVRSLHVGLYALTTGPETQQGIRRLAPGFLGGPVLLLVAGFFDGALEGVLWATALAVDYGVVYIRGNEGFDIQAVHFVERYRLIVIIALGEILIEMGFGAAGLGLGVQEIVGILFGMVFVVALWWLYFDYVAPAAECTLASTHGEERAMLALVSYSYIHFPLVAGIIFSAFGIEETLAHLGTSPELISTVALYGGAALYLLGHVAFRQYDVGSISVPRLVVAVVTVALIPVAVRVPALVALAGLAVVFVGLVGYETANSEIRRRVRED